MPYTPINYQKEIQNKLTKSLIDMIILQNLNQQPMHGYQIITKTRKTFGIYFSPSTIYPLLTTLEKKGYLNSLWDTTAEKPRKIFTITSAGKNILKFTENSLGTICKTIHSPQTNKTTPTPLTITPLTN
jgi:PadR family transcriptional regulator PadR